MAELEKSNFLKLLGTTKDEEVKQKAWEDLSLMEQRIVVSIHRTAETREASIVEWEKHVKKQLMESRGWKIINYDDRVTLKKAKNFLKSSK